MSDPVIWLIIVVFYAPLHFMLPVLFLFLVGNETETIRKQLIRKALIDAAISMVLAFAIAIALVSIDQITTAMVVLILFMLVPFLRITINRKKL